MVTISVALSGAAKRSPWAKIPYARALFLTHTSGSGVFIPHFDSSPELVIVWRFLVSVHAARCLTSALPAALSLAVTIARRVYLLAPRTSASVSIGLGGSHAGVW